MSADVEHRIETLRTIVRGLILARSEAQTAGLERLDNLLEQALHEAHTTLIGEGHDPEELPKADILPFAIPKSQKRSPEGGT